MEPDQRQLLANVLPLLAIVLMASGILVQTVPLKSKRPSDSHRANFFHAGRQDVEARLWADPFVALRHVTGDSPYKRCKNALEDTTHHPSTLKQSINYMQNRRGYMVTVLPVMVPGGRYFENGELRRRSRYAVVTALLNRGWTPSEEDKLGYVWTFANCIEKPWKRQMPELLPYEWFVGTDQPRDNKPAGAGAQEGQARALLVLWVDEDTLVHRPLQGIEKIIELLAQGSFPCPPADQSPYWPDLDLRIESKELKQLCSSPEQITWLQATGCPWDRGKSQVNFNVVGDPIQGPPPWPWCDTRVIGPSTSSTLMRLERELAGDRPKTNPGWLRFYSSGATATFNDSAQQNKMPNSFKQRVIRLTTTDDKLATAFIEELEKRLATPFSPIAARLKRKGVPLCDDPVVVISEGDTIYARSFLNEFENRLKDLKPSFCGKGDCRVHAVRYLRGLDGALPEGTGTPVSSASQPSQQERTNLDGVFEQATLERADGLSQYDYLRRLAAHLVELDRREKNAGCNGVRAVGVLGNDVYDKLLVLDALRDRFPEAVFFTADLDARLLGREVIRSTRNLVVASAYGLTLNPGIQGAAPPFRDTYQSGMYLSTLVALDPDLRQLPADHFESWFPTPQLFEIGRTRAVPLSKGAYRECDMEELREMDKCRSIHALDAWFGFSPWPDLVLVLTLLLVVALTVVLGCCLSRYVRGVVSVAWHNAAFTKMLVVPLPLLILMGVWWIIWRDATADGGEPFAWFEGISIWPSQLCELLVLMVTVVLLFFGRWEFYKTINTVAKEFRLTPLSQHKSATTLRAKGERGLWSYIRWLWWPDQTEVDSSGSGTEAGPWLAFLDRMRVKPSFMRISVLTTLLFFFGIAILSLDWPHSPHRGMTSAWFNHILLLLLLIGMMALLFTVLDVFEMTTRYFTHLGPSTPCMPRGEEPTNIEFQARDPIVDNAVRLHTRFRFAVKLASRIDRFIYLPFFTLLLVLPIRSRVFDAWDIPLPYIALLGVSVMLTVRGMLSLRRAAAALKTQILAQLDGQMERLELAPYTRSTETSATLAPGADPEDKGTADLLRRTADEIRSVQEGPFRPLTQEPVVRALLIVCGWAGGLSTVEFLFLK